jgi:predicted transcriptional regulator
MSVDQHSTSPVACVRPESKLTDALASMREKGVSSLAVTDGNNRLLGVLSRTDILREATCKSRGAALELPDLAVARAMTTAPLTVKPSTQLGAAAAAMVADRVHRIFVLDGDELASVLTTRDVMDAIALKRLNKPVGSFMSSPIFSIRATEPLSLGTERLEKAHVTGLVVMDEDWPVGIYTQREALASKDFDPRTPVEEVMSPAILLLDQGTPIHRAAAQARATRVRRVVALENGRAAGILTGLDFAKAAAD